MLKPSSDPSRLKLRATDRGVPTLLTRVLPLPLSRVPVMSNAPPATGFPVIGLIDSCVSDLTVNLKVEEFVGRRVEEPLKKN